LRQRIGDDGFHLLAAVEQAAQEGMDWLQQLPAVQTLEQTWAQQYCMTNGHERPRTATNGHERPRTATRVASRRRNARRWGSGCAPPTTAMCATARKRSLEWIG
jgi:hypothetical protein